MTITVQNIHLMQSERITDDPDGGGKMSPREVVDGELNNLFSDRSQLDSIYGRFSMRKAFPWVNTLTQDTYFGAYGFVSDPPDDERVDILVFTTGSYTDERVQAQSYVENYRTRSVISPYTLYGDHYPGNRTLQMYCRDGDPTPDIGDVLCLRTESVGYPANEQYVAVEEVLSRVTRTFTDSSGDFQRDVITASLTTSFSFTFYGRDPPSRYSVDLAPTRIRYTQISDQSAYYGVKALVVSAEEGDLSVDIGNPYVSLVPASRAETPISDVRAGLGTISMVKSSADGALAIPTFAGSGAAAEPTTRYFGNSYARRTLSISVGGVMLRDDGHGGIESVSPLDTGWSGTADYETGSVTFLKDGVWAASVNISATAAGAITEQGFSEEIPIIPANRQLSYVYQFPNDLSPGTVVVDFMALGKWIRLYDRGNGQLSGNSGEGTGNINYSTASMSFTLGALPDIDSSIIISWGNGVRARDSHGDIVVSSRRFTQQLLHTQILPDSLTITWVSGSVPRTATTNTSGIISGDAVGELDYVAGIARFYTSNSPDPGEQYHYTYSWAPIQTEVYTGLTVSGSGQVTITIPFAIEPGSVKAQWMMKRASTYNWSRPSLFIPGLAFDDGAGGWQGNTALDTDTIDYPTGDIVLTVEQEKITWIPQYAFRKNSTTGGICAYVTGYELGNVGFEFDGSNPLRVEYMKAGDAATVSNESYPAPPLVFLMSENAAGPGVPGSVRFSYRGLTYVDRAGSLFHSVNPATGTGVLSGSYNYSTNTVTLTEYGTTGNVVNVTSLLTRYVDPGVSAFFFRAPGSPLKPGSFVVRATTLDGVMLIGSSDINGNITGDQMKGKVDWETGIARLSFGTLVTAAGNEAEAWYDPDFVSGGMIWKPEQVDPASVFIGTVVYRPVPMNPEVLGLDPVRLPSDGRVLAFRVGDVAVIHNTKINTITSPVAGSTHSMGRDRLSFLELRDSNGVAVDAIWYTLDLDAGTITFANPLNLSAYTGPFKARHRIEDASRILDVEITGGISFESPLTHDYTSGDTYVSSCIIYGDMRARYTNIFDQVTWTGVWSDTQIGSAATGTYNDQFFPIEITNRGAITERWAIIFKSTSTVDVVGEESGVILSNVSIASDIAPINPITITDDDPGGFPYFVMKTGGFGAGWSLGNVIRFNTVSATRPTWFARCTRPGPIEVPNDSFRFQIYGDATV